MENTPDASNPSTPGGSSQYQNIVDSHGNPSQIIDKPTPPEPDQIRKAIENWINTEKQGLKDRFYEMPLANTIVEKATGMAVKLMTPEYGCSKELAQNLSILSLYDLAILIDDSLSMITEEGGKRIEALEKTLGLVARVYELVREDGIVTIEFLNELDGEDNIGEVDIPAVIKEHKFTGWTRIGTELERKILNRLVHKEMGKPLLVLTITDGDIEGEEKGALVSVIDKCIKRLQHDAGGKDEGAHAVAFQFAKVGNDKGAERLLRDLDNDEHVGNYVDRFPVGIEALDKENQKWGLLAKLLLGGIVRSFDKADGEAAAGTREIQVAQPARQRKDRAAIRRAKAAATAGQV